MATMRLHERLSASADEVWKLISDVGGIAAWFPGIDSSSASESGDQRTCTMGELELVETIVTNDDELRRLQYSISGGPFVPEHHLATVDVIEDGDGSLLVYSCDVLPDDAAAIIKPALEGGVAALKERFG